jgi:hypothetical protein
MFVAAGRAIGRNRQAALESGKPGLPGMIVMHGRTRWQWAATRQSGGYLRGAW